LYDHEDPFREHLTPDVKHNIVIIDYKVNYDQQSFWSLKKDRPFWGGNRENFKF